MTINVEIIRSGSENTASVLRKFSRSVRSMGLVRHMRKRRYSSRNLSEAVERKQALRRIARRKEHEQMVKDGKIAETPQGGFKRR